ncbi:MAG TPA: ChbG/HpnK family deacetylase [Acidimicrobiales bacterium]|nr:ChbG/HpnK family deacetylase [Acidimicrobiales bacterium]
MSRSLVVNADDYGLTLGVSSAILAAHERGVVTSTSVLTLAPAFPATAPWLRSHERLATGLHLALVGEDPPALTAAEIPTLVTDRGRLHESWRTLVPRLAAGRVDPDDVRRELSAQHEAFLGAGLTLSHLDSHQHLHLWPSVTAVVLDLADAWGRPAVRLPSAHRRGPTALGVRALGRRLGPRLDRAGLAHADACFGLDESGHLDRAAWDPLLRRLRGRPDGTVVEIGTHPGAAEDPARDRYRWGFAWPAEHRALTDPTLRAAIADAGYDLVSYADPVVTRRVTGSRTAGSNGSGARAPSTGTGG